MEVREQSLARGTGDDVEREIATLVKRAAEA